MNKCPKCGHEWPDDKRASGGKARWKGTKKADRSSAARAAALARWKTKKADGPQNVSVIEISNASKSGLVHPTQKPVALMEYLIRTYTNEGQTVLDNTMGSGTTGVACVNTGRRFVGIERDEAYFAIARQRIEEAYAALPLFSALPNAGDVPRAPTT